MDKRPMANPLSGNVGMRVLPTAPPSYEEAVGLPTSPTITTMPVSSGGLPYPVTNSPVPMSMPMSMPMPMAMPMPMPVPTSMNQPGPVAAPGQPVPVAAPAPSRADEQQRSQRPMPYGTNAVGSAVTVLGPNPMYLQCQSCGEHVKTTTMSDHQPSAHVCCIILCLTGCCLCSCLPYCLSAFLSVHHFCPNCKAYIGTWKG